MQQRNKILILLVCVFLLIGCREDRAEGYQVLSKDFVAAIQNIKADYFFAADPPQPKPAPYKTAQSLENEKYFLATKHFASLSEKLCSSVEENYARMLESGLTGKDARAFDEELTRAMREAGAYALPLRIEGGQVDAAYYNPNWDRNPGAKYGGNKEFNEDWRRLWGTKLQHSIAPTAYKEGGILEYSFNMWKGVRNIFHTFLITQKKFELRRFTFRIDVVHPYLFIFQKDPGDPEKESLFFYIDFPLAVSGDEFGKISHAGKTETEPQVRCNPTSVSRMRSLVLDSIESTDFKSSGKSIALITEVSPLIIPLPADYTRSSDAKYEHDILPESVAEPSIECWMAAYGYLPGDHAAECTKTGYADEFMEMLNRDLCVGYDFVRPAPARAYPYHAKAWIYEQQFMRGAVYDPRRCNPDPDPETGKETKDER